MWSFQTCSHSVFCSFFQHILTECQDKALRRMTELKEQCNLEKQAKAHLEEALRSDLEEKDHLIHTLNTKVCFLLFAMFSIFFYI